MRILQPCARVRQRVLGQEGAYQVAQHLDGADPVDLEEVPWTVQRACEEMPAAFPMQCCFPAVQAVQDPAGRGGSQADRVRRKARGTSRVTCSIPAHLRPHHRATPLAPTLKLFCSPAGELVCLPAMGRVLGSKRASACKQCPTRKSRQKLHHTHRRSESGNSERLLLFATAQSTELLGWAGEGSGLVQVQDRQPPPVGGRRCMPA